MTERSYALVTGASRGLGKYFARALAARQQNLVLVARDNERLAKLAGELEKTCGIRAQTLALDLASPGAGGRLAEQLKERGLKIDLLVNNAGFGDSGEFLKLSLARQLEMISLQNATVVELTYKLLPAMIADWRKAWGQGDFPFMIVQLANYDPRSPADKAKSAAHLRRFSMPSMTSAWRTSRTRCGSANAAELRQRTKR